MPLTKTGQKVMQSMKEQYGSEKGRNVFYATANKQNLREKWERKKSAIQRRLQRSSE